MILDIYAARFCYILQACHKTITVETSQMCFQPPGDLLSTTGPLAGEKTLSELGITTGAVLEAVLTFDPSPMYLVNPEVTEYLLLFRHDASKKWVYNMDIAPAEAQRIVADMRPVSSIPPKQMGGVVRCRGVVICKCRCKDDDIRLPRGSPSALHVCEAFPPKRNLAVGREHTLLDR